MRVVVTGATGNVGTAVVRQLADRPEVDSIVGVSRRATSWQLPKTEWVQADVAEDELGEVMRGADAVVHLAWIFHPTRRSEVTWNANVCGTTQVAEAAAKAHVPVVVVASSVGAYSPRADLTPVTESWPTGGCRTAAYSREKAAVETLLDRHEQRWPEQRVVRLRPAFIFQPQAAVSQRRIFLGPLVPHAALRPGVLPAVPLPPRLHLQAVHADDVARAYVAAVLNPVHGAFNIAAEPVLDPADLAHIMRSRAVAVPGIVLRQAVAMAFHARLVPVHPGLVDLALSVPMMSAVRAREELGWAPERSANLAVQSFFEGLQEGADAPTAPLAKETSGPFRINEWRTGVGARSRTGP